MEFWFTKSTARILKEHYQIDPDNELIKIMDDLVETHVVDAWYFIQNLTNDQIKFVYNNIGFETFSNQELVDFFSKTEKVANRKLIAIEWVSTKNLETAIEKFKTQQLDPSILDFLEGKMTDEKTINWGVGQVMKAHPRTYSAQEIKEAIIERWFK